jgi:hypothetical protein
MHNTVRELIAVKVLHTSLLKTTVVSFKVLPFGRYAPMPALIPTFKTNFKLVLWNGVRSCRCIPPDVINVSKFLHFNISFISGNRSLLITLRGLN